MTPWLPAVVLSIAAAAGYAVAAVAQQRLAARPSPRSGPLGPLRSPRWWLAVTPNALGAGLHVLALRYGSLVVVQPFGALTLVLALPLGALLTGYQVTGREWRGAIIVVVGLTALTLANDPREPTSTLAPLTVVGLVAFTVGVVGLLVLIANGWPASRTACLATASGTASAIASVLTQTALLRLADPATGADLVFVAVAVMIIVLAIGGLLLAQAAYATGLGLPLAVLTIANPVTAGAVGLTLFEHPVGPSSAGLLLTALAMLVTSHGVVLLTTSGTSRHHPRYGRRRTAQLPAHTPEDDRP